ncbi:MAG: hypothetical protein IPM45_18070 [Acidimicrobiales bacterium]|nr:hypothetical protein [Acidimicrobiales bacterium]
MDVDVQPVVDGLGRRIGEQAVRIAILEAQLAALTAELARLQQTDREVDR